MAPNKYPIAFRPAEAAPTKEEKEQIQKEFEEEKKKEEENRIADENYPGGKQEKDPPCHQEFVVIPSAVQVIKTVNTVTNSSSQGQVIVTAQPQIQTKDQVQTPSENQSQTQSQQQALSNEQKIVNAQQVLPQGQIIVNGNGQQQGQVFIVVDPTAQKNTSYILNSIPRWSMQTVCPNCNKQVYTKIQYENNAIIFLLCIVLCFFTCICGIIPLFFNSLKDCVHYCPNCGREIARDSK
ncbi:hypothetical protein PIROE2DRAFT_5774 [Piromyces sp. E2]|nr:hypothetical protein PIROE2DRAFT_5774 [Piromyces sp. E2]|eukprot:OUM66916.1 hypothetical protein PIROE2DRAFT_5774 [Piromyces sp. E2]